MFKSKKFWATLVAVVTAVGSGVTGVLSWPTVALTVVGSIVGYVGAQGIADAGKEAAKINSEK